MVHQLWAPGVRGALHAKGRLPQGFGGCVLANLWVPQTAQSGPPAGVGAQKRGNSSSKVVGC